MIDHFEIKVSNFQQCQTFYGLVLKPLNIELKWADEFAAGFGPFDDSSTRFLIEQAPTVSLCHIAFVGVNREGVDKFHAIGTSKGYLCNGEPGLRTAYAPNYYAAFLLDPDGNNIEAVVRL